MAGTDYDLHNYYDVYNNIAFSVLHARIAFGLQWRIDMLTLGFEAIGVEAPIAVLSARGQYDTGYRGSDKRGIDANAEATRKAGAWQWTLPRLAVGFAF